MLHVLWLLGRTDLNATEGSACRSAEHLSVTSHLFLSSFAHFSHLLTSAYRGAFSVSSAEVLCVVLHIPARTHQAWCLCLERSQGRNEHVYVGMQTMSSAQYSMGKERRRSCCFLNSMCCLTCCSGTPAASRHSHQWNTTVLKNCFGLTVGTNY